VNPETAARDVNVVKALQAQFGHLDMGLYAEVLEGGRLAVGDRVETSATRVRSNLGHRWRFLRFLARSARVALRGR
jgi:MOSC domain-containing protein YiiM